MYLAEVAVLTRLATGLTRVLENRPSKQQNPQLSEGQKKQAMAERFFVEILGTMGYMACLHLGQDLVDKLANCQTRILNLSNESLLKGLECAPHLNHLTQLLKKINLAVDDLDLKLRESVAETYGEVGKPFKNPVFSTLYEHELPGSTEKLPLVGKANLQTVKKQWLTKIEQVAEQKGVVLPHPEIDAALSKIVNEVKPLKAFAKRNNHLAVLGIFTGVVGSALVGGSLTQWMNDRVIAPGAKKFFNRAVKHNQSVAVPSVEQREPVAHKSLSLLSASGAVPTLSVGGTSSLMPVYLPNPKTQAQPPILASQLLLPIQTLSNPAMRPWPGGG